MGGGDPQVAFTPAGTAIFATLATRVDETGRTRRSCTRTDPRTGDGPGPHRSTSALPTTTRCWRRTSRAGPYRRPAVHERPLRTRVQPRRLPLGGRRPKLDRSGEVPGRRRRAGAQRGPAAGAPRRDDRGSLRGLPLEPRADRELDRIAHLDGCFDRRGRDLLRAETGPGEADGRRGARGEGGDGALPGRLLDHARGGSQRALPGPRLRRLAELFRGSPAHRDLLDGRPGVDLDRSAAGSGAPVPGSPAVPARGRRQPGRRAGSELVRHAPGAVAVRLPPVLRGLLRRWRDLHRTAPGVRERSPSPWGPATSYPRRSPSAERRESCGSP